MNLDQQQIAAVFDEWAKRYANNPEQFGEILDADGKPVEDYGQCCAIYFCKIASDIEVNALHPINADADQQRPQLHRPGAATLPQIGEFVPVSGALEVKLHPLPAIGEAPRAQQYEVAPALRRGAATPAAQGLDLDLALPGASTELDAPTIQREEAETETPPAPPSGTPDGQALQIEHL